jgi:hypothetical protein
MKADLRRLRRYERSTSFSFVSLFGPYLRREAVLSSRIEGTQTTLGDVYAAEAEQLRLVTSPDVQEVVNYVDAARYGPERLRTLPLSLRFLRELHERLMARGVRGHGSRGEFRTHQNFIGGTGEANATYVPPPLTHMHECLDDFERFMHERPLPPLIQAAEDSRTAAVAAGNCKRGRPRRCALLESAHDHWPRSRAPQRDPSHGAGNDPVARGGRDPARDHGPSPRHGLQSRRDLRPTASIGRTYGVPVFDRAVLSDSEPPTHFSAAALTASS